MDILEYLTQEFGVAEVIGFQINVSTREDMPGIHKTGASIQFADGTQVSVAAWDWDAIMSRYRKAQEEND